ncbi:hypothetical protein HZA98_01270 [Candidatus Woesearchaeota archaeon]|nr:hypothetical protein [Candidatus Woesearchaeota archaeon]
MVSVLRGTLYGAIVSFALGGIVFGYTLQLALFCLPLGFFFYCMWKNWA